MDVRLGAGKRRRRVLLHGWQLLPVGIVGYRSAEVTFGGVDTADLLSSTMRAKHLPGLSFIGDVADVTGHLGGNNFQWAWSFGFVASDAP